MSHKGEKEKEEGRGREGGKEGGGEKEGERGDEGTTIQIYLAEGEKINLVSCMCTWCVQPQRPNCS